MVAVRRSSFFARCALPSRPLHSDTTRDETKKFRTTTCLVSRFTTLFYSHICTTTQGQTAADLPFSTWTWKEYKAKVDAFGKALLSIGFEPFDVINILGFNSREWFTANFGTIAAGGVAAGIYATNLPDACKYISEHSDAKVVVVEGLKQLEKYIEIGAELPSLKALVMYGTDVLTAETKEKYPVPVYTFDEFLDLGKDVPDADIKARSDALKPNATCTLIYTSGTTGPPKAVMITHDNLTWTIQAVFKNLPGGGLTPKDRMISYLPLSHIAAQMLDMHASAGSGMQIYFAQPDALKGTLGATLKEVRPTMFFGVPRVWEKIYGEFVSRLIPFLLCHCHNCPCVLVSFRSLTLPSTCPVLGCDLHRETPGGWPVDHRY